MRLLFIAALQLFTLGDSDSFVSLQNCETSLQTFPLLSGQYKTKLKTNHFFKTTVLKSLLMFLLFLTLPFATHCRCGFAGETGPRFIIPSEIRKPGQQHVRRNLVLDLVMFLGFFLFNVACGVSLF